MVDFSLLALALFVGLLTLFLYDFKKLFVRNLHKLKPENMTDANAVPQSVLCLDKDGNTTIKGVRKYPFSRYL